MRRKICKACDGGIMQARLDYPVGGTFAQVSAFWECRNCGHTQPRIVRKTAKQKRLDRLYEELAEGIQ